MHWLPQVGHMGQRVYLYKDIQIHTMDHFHKEFISMLFWWVRALCCTDTRFGMSLGAVFRCWCGVRVLAMAIE